MQKTHNLIFLINFIIIIILQNSPILNNIEKSIYINILIINNILYLLYEFYGYVKKILFFVI